MIEERKQFLLETKIIQFRKEYLIFSGKLLFHWNKFSDKNIIDGYIGDSIKEKLYRYMIDFNDLTECVWCGHPTKYKTISAGFDDYCSSRCVRQHVKSKGNFTTKGYKHSSEMKKYLSENHADFTGDKNPFGNACKKNPELAIEVGRRKKQWWSERTEEEMEQISETFSKAQAKNKNVHNHKNHKSGFFYSVKNESKYYFRSSWEEKVCSVLENDVSVESFSLEEFYIEYDFGTKKRFARIDFYVIVGDRNILIEVKPEGLWNHNNNPHKIKGMQEYCNKNNIDFYLVGKKRLDSNFFELMIKGEIENDNFTRFE